VIRFLFLILVFAAGLSAAVIYQGRLHHLKLVYPGPLPAWTDRIAPDAGLRRGSMRLAGDGTLPDLTLAWTARLPNLQGWHWRLRLSGDGVDLGADLTLSHWPDRAVVAGGSGTVDLARLSPEQAGVGGVLALTALGATGSDLLQAPVFQGDVDGRLSGVSAGDADFGQGPLAGILTADGSWHVDAQLEGGVSPVTVRISGQMGQSLARADLSIENGADLPDRLRGVLGTVGRAAGAGWRVTVDVPVF
jgi:hypothetical protein